MSSLFGINRPNTNLRKSAFDLSQKHLFNMSAGMLLPCMVEECNPGEKFRISLDAFTRTMPLNTAAFVRCRQYYHFFFVPFSQLWSGFPNFINGVNRKTTALNANMRCVEVPAVDFFSCMGKLFENDVVLKSSDATKSKKSLDEHGYEYYRGISRLLDMLGYGFSYEYEGKTYTTFSDLVDGLFYVKRNGRNYNSPDWPTYGDYWNTPDGREEYESRYDPRGNFSASPEEFSRKLPEGHPYVQEWLYSIDTGNFVDTLDIITSIKFKFNPFRLLAYQKIYQDFYKRDDYEATDPKLFNFDDIETLDSRQSVERILGIFRLRYRWLPKDYFTGVVPSELFDGLGTENVANNPTSLLNSFDSGTAGLNRDGDKVSISGSVNTRSIRAMFAIEKMLKLTRRAGATDYISQTLAHYGYEPPKGLGDKVEFIGGVTSNIDISEVITNSATDNQMVGQIYGRGTGNVESRNQSIEYQAKEHGLLMCITSVVPDLDYNNDGLHIANAKFKRGSYFHPELQDLGLQPIFGFELSNKVAGNREVNLFDSNNSANGGILGYSARYSEYKTSYDRLHGQFRNGQSFSAWSATQLVKSDNTGVIISTLKINPKCLDRIFPTNFDGKEQNDQFMVSAQFSIKSIRPMSVTGQNL
uniref:Major capsid protein n=2 Tax=Dulem virus 235 TaxID=3145712 RepID=A0AAU8B580_9VIRU